MNKKIVIVSISIVLIAAAAFGYSSLTPSASPNVSKGVNQREPKVLPNGVESYEVPEGAVVITLSEVGYTPNTVTIRKGDTIAFKTTGKDLFWPASNLHPSHAIYAEFDPQEPIAPNLVWSFKFDTIGEWRFHDHLAPYFTGTITVTD